MTKVTIGVVVLFATGCIARAPGLSFGTSTTPANAIEPSSDPAAASADEASGGPPHAPGEDAHWFSQDDYLVSEQGYEGKKTMVSVAKMTELASGQTKAEAHFLIASGEDLWTAHYYRSRVAVRTDLVIGALAFCSGGYYEQAPEAPKDKHDARQGEWFIAAITDTADLYKGRVTVGNASCALGAVRVPIQ